MQEAVPEGSGLMAAILGMERQEVEKTCVEAAKNGIVGPANYNSPGQIVIAGEKKAVEKAMEIAKAAGAKKVVPLAVSVPSHCRMMQKAGERLAQELDRIAISDLRIPIVNNADAKFMRAAAELKPSLIRQISSPLYWEDSIRNMAAEGYDTFIEIGPGKVLSGLVKRIAKEARDPERRGPEEHAGHARRGRTFPDHKEADRESPIVALLLVILIASALRVVRKDQQSRICYNGIGIESAVRSSFLP